MIAVKDIKTRAKELDALGFDDIYARSSDSRQKLI